MNRRRIGFGLLAVAMLALAAHTPKADIRILTHDRTDPAPRQLRAALDTGLLAVSLLVTWTAKH